MNQYCVTFKLTGRYDIQVCAYDLREAISKASVELNNNKCENLIIDSSDAVHAFIQKENV